MMDFFACGSTKNKVTKMSDFSRKHNRIDRQNNLEPLLDGLTAENDLLMEQILENMNSTPLGQVLKNIAVLPEVSRQKVLRVRRQLTQGRYDLNERLDVALEKVLTDLDF
jgi:hypothetical protein